LVKPLLAYTALAVYKPAMGACIFFDSKELALAIRSASAEVSQQADDFTGGME